MLISLAQSKAFCMQLFLKQLEKFINTIGFLCSMLMILMVLNVFYDVIARYFFNDVNIGMQELEWHLFAAMFMFGIGYTLKEDGHVRVDIFYDNMTVRSQSLINLFGSIFFVTPIVSLILYFGWDYAHEAFLMGEGSPDPGGLPHRWIVRSVIPISSAFLLLCNVYVILTNIQRLNINSNNQKGLEL